ncbi:MAG: flavohemoprotein [Deltaproteobacteria bacterium]|nr:flavohemoprotein [Deltaproteobacteria bacterium]
MSKELLQANLDLISERDPELIGGFYTLLFERFPQARALFGRNSQAEQQKMLTEALVMLVSHLDDEAFVVETMTGVGRKHVDYGVEDHMYGWVGECLVATFARVSGDDWNDELAGAWTNVVETISAIAIRSAQQERASRVAS